jgi:hypothetical protein
MVPELDPLVHTDGVPGLAVAEVGYEYPFVQTADGSHHVSGL